MANAPYSACCLSVCMYTPPEHAAQAVQDNPYNYYKNITSSMKAKWQCRLLGLSGIEEIRLY